MDPAPSYIPPPDPPSPPQEIVCMRCLDHFAFAPVRAVRHQSSVMHTSLPSPVRTGYTAPISGFSFSIRALVISAYRHLHARNMSPARCVSMTVSALILPRTKNAVSAPLLGPHPCGSHRPPLAPLSRKQAGSPPGHRSDELSPHTHTADAVSGRTTKRTKLRRSPYL